MTPEIDHQHDNVTLRESARQAAELAAMRRMIQASSECFSLSVAVCNSPALREFLIARLKETFPKIAVVEAPRETTDVFGYVKGRKVGDDAAGLFLTNLEASISTKEQDQPTLRSLNASRELWERAFRCPFVIWVPEWAATALARHAKDLWRYRSHRFEFVSEQASADAAVSDAFSGDLAGASNLSLEEKQFRLAELAQRLADWGDDPSSDLLPHALTWLNEAAFLRYATGDLDGAEAMFRKALEINEKLGRLEDMASLYGNLGNVLSSRGDLDDAEAMYRKSLAINEKLGHLEGMAIQYGNLGIVLSTRGDLDGAEAMFQKSLEIDEKLGRLEGLANQYGNLGNVLLTRGDLDGAEAMFRKALEFDEKLGRLEGMASMYGNLGIVLKTRGDLDGAEAMIRKSLEINEKLGHLEGIASQYGNLGNVLLRRGDLDGAEAMHRKSLKIEEKLGRLEGMASDYGNLGNLLQTRGDLNGAEAMYCKSLEINEKLGRLEGMAGDYANLGNVMQARGDLNGAREQWAKALDLYQRVGMPHMVERMQEWLDAIGDIRTEDAGSES